MKKIIFFAIILVALLAGGYWIYNSMMKVGPAENEEIGEKWCVLDSDCVVFGEDGDCNCGCFNKSHNWQKQGNCFCMAPSVCQCVEGKCEDVFGDRGNEIEKKNLIIIESPAPNEAIESPLIVKGKARGYWFFEGDFPVVLTNWDGLIISQGIAQAKGEWMTEDFVLFEARLDFDKPDYSNRGSLILQKDNPSGLPENDDALEITVFFK